MAVVQLRDASVLDWMIDSGEDGEMLNYSALNGSWCWKEDFYDAGFGNWPAGAVHSPGAGTLEEVQMWSEDQRALGMLQMRYPSRDVKQTDA